MGTDFSLPLFDIAVVAYSLAMAAFAVAFALRRDRFTGVGVGLVMLGWCFHLASIVTRGIIAQHWPLGNMYEYSLGIAFVMVTTYLVVALRFQQRLVGLPVMMLTVGLLGVAYMLYVPPGSLVPALHSYWLYIHVTAMASASGILTFSFLFAMGYLARRWADETVAAGRSDFRGSIGAQAAGSAAVAAVPATRSVAIAAAIRRLLPPAKALDTWSARFVMLGFPIWSFGVICGAIWGEHAWGRYWAWDPKETFAFITWVVFAIYLHARVTYGWKEKRAAYITLAGMVAIIFTLYAVNLWIAGLHSYARA